MTAPRTAVARTQQTAELSTDEKKGIVALITSETARGRIGPFLPQGIDIARVAASVLLECKRNPALLRCSGESIVLAVARIHSWDLTVGEEAYLVPFGQVCTPIAGYMGLAKLMQMSGAARAVDSFCVFEGEHFVYHEGTEQRVEHHVAAMNRGRMIGAYARVRLAFGHYKIHYMPLEEIDAIRLKYSKQWKDGPCPEWYARKCVIRQVAKLIPKSGKLMEVYARIEEDEEQLVREAMAEGTEREVPALGPGGVTAPDADYADTNEEPPAKRPEPKQCRECKARYIDAWDHDPRCALYSDPEFADELPLTGGRTPVARSAQSEGR